MKKVLMLSGKGGTGKTTLASALVKLFSAKVLCDCDVDAPNLHIINSFDSEPKKYTYVGGKRVVFNGENCIGCGICAEKCRFSALSLKNDGIHYEERLCEGCGVCEYVCPVSAFTLCDDESGFVDVFNDGKILSTAELKVGRGNSGKLVTEVKKRLFEEVENEKNIGNNDIGNEYDVAILDGSPGVGCPVMASLSGVDVAVVVTEPTLSGFEDLKRILKTVRMCGVKSAVVVNKFDLNCEITDKICDFCVGESVNVLGKIPYSSKNSEMINQGRSIVDFECPMADSIRDIYVGLKRLLGV